MQDVSFSKMYGRNRPSGWHRSPPSGSSTKVAAVLHGSIKHGRIHDRALRTRVQSSSAIENFKGVLNLREIYKL